MAVVKNLLVRAGADFSPITQQATKASQSMRGMQKSVSSSCNLMSKAAGGLSKAFGAIGIGLSIGAIISFGKEAAAAYDSQVEGETRLAQVMRNTMGARNEDIQSILDLTAAQQKLGVVGDEAQLAGAQELATYLSLTDSLETLIPVMNDMAVQQYGFNVTAEQTANIATMLGKVMEGQVGGLSRYGYYFDEAQEAVLKYGTEAERAAMLAEVVEQSVGGMNQALAATPTGRMRQLSNAIGDIKEQFGQAVRTIGTVFLPLLNAVGTVLAGIATVANKVAQAIANIFGGTVAGKEWEFLPASGAVEDASGAMDDLTDSTQEAGKAAKQTKKELQTLGFDTLNIMRAQSESSGSSGTKVGTGSGGSGKKTVSELDTVTTKASDSIGGLEEKLAGLKQKWEEFRDRLDFGPLLQAWGNLKDAVSGFASVVVEKIGFAWDTYLAPLAEWTINDALPAVFDTLARAFDAVSAAAEKMNPLIENTARVIAPLADLFGEKFVQDIEDVGFAFEVLTTLLTEGPAAAFRLVRDHAKESAKETRKKWKDFPTWWNEHFTIPVSDGIQKWEQEHPRVKQFFENVTDDITLFFDDFPTWWDTKVRQPISDGLKGWLEDHPKIKEFLTGVEEDFKLFFGDFPTWWDTKVRQPLRDWINDWLEKHPVLKGILELFTGDIDEMTGGASASFDEAETSISGTLERIKGLFNFEWNLPELKLPHITVGRYITYPVLGTVPDPFSIRVDWYAKGGVFDKASLIGVGEAGKEAVVPLERNTEWISTVADGIVQRISGTATSLLGGDLAMTLRQAVCDGMIMASREGSVNGPKVVELDINGRQFYRATYEDLQSVIREQGISLIGA